MDQTTPIWLESIYLFVLGAGIGLIMQILTLIVQNTAEYRDLGTATSGVTFFRTLGGAFGAVGARQHLLQPTRRSAAGSGHPVRRRGDTRRRQQIPEALWALPEADRAPVVEAYNQSLHSVFVWAIPIALLALVAALFLPQVTLRGRERAKGTGEGFAVPEGADADTQLENVIGQVLRRKGKSAAPEVLAGSGSTLDNATAWGVMGVYLRDAITGAASQASIERERRRPGRGAALVLRRDRRGGYLTRDGDRLRLTASGQVQVQKITTAWRGWLVAELKQWLPGAGADIAETQRVDAALDRIVVRLVRESENELEASAT